MKRIFLLLAVIGMTAFQSCSSDDDVYVDHDTIAEVFEINQNTSFTPANNFTISYTLNPPIYNSDMILIYRLSGSQGTLDVWELLPQTYNFPNGDFLQYTYDFSVNTIRIYMEGNFDLTEEPGFTLNQVFRVVIIPGFLSNRGGEAVDLNDYNAVIEAYGINENNIRTIQ